MENHQNPDFFHEQQPDYQEIDLNSKFKPSNDQYTEINNRECFFNEHFATNNCTPSQGQPNSRMQFFGERFAERNISQNLFPEPSNHNSRGPSVEKMVTCQIIASIRLINLP